MATRTSIAITPIPVAKLMDEVRVPNLVRLIQSNKVIGEKIQSITPVAIKVELRFLAVKNS
ncbi:hypothetical protein [Lactobacillus taiwanensis]|uniref:hypothetical protein n=1 Tax=Lactobacillus taiwanensis TaxID=508451 RepID=UPI0025AFF9DD|nr:hypothetical protein [Lactobacillus taiwanensis]